MSDHWNARNLLRIADNVRDAYMIGEHIQNQRDTVVYSKEDKDAIERALREVARAVGTPVAGTEAMALADEYEAGLRKMEAAGYEEFSEIIPKHRLVIAALRAAGAVSEPVASAEARLREVRPAAFLLWAIETFGPVAKLRSERLMRFVEEAIELAHADNMERAVLDVIANRVYSRPAGDVSKEIGQAQACLETYAENIGESATALAEREWQRVRTVPKTEWERRHAAKQAIGIALSQPAGDEATKSRRKNKEVVTEIISRSDSESDFGKWCDIISQMGSRAAPSDPAPNVLAMREALNAAFDALVAMREAVKQSGTMNGRNYVSLGIQVNDALDKAKAAIETSGWKCAARRQGTAGGNDPADCDWPGCGCDPTADKVIAALQESGALTAAPSLPDVEEIARKLMEFDGHRLWELDEQQVRLYNDRAAIIAAIQNKTGGRNA
jgi:hypothetical protein